MQDQETPTYSEKPGRTPAILAAAVLVVGAIVSWFGLNGGALITPQESSTSYIVDPSAEAVKFPTDAEERQSLLTAGEALSRAHCIGCHDSDSKLTGPSFESIAQKYSPRSPSNLSQLSPDFSQALAHQGASIDGFESAPTLKLTTDEKRAVGFWILNSFRRSTRNIVGSDK